MVKSRMRAVVEFHVDFLFGMIPTQRCCGSVRDVIVDIFKPVCVIVVVQ